MEFIDLLNMYHIMPQFPPVAVRQTESMPREVRDEDLKGRLDLTGKMIITIDGDDAKDFDDAVSVEKNERGNYVLGVHIADVSHYVTEDSPIDRAAFARGTSVYLIDTVIPMLPFELSNGLCSLRPHEVRLTLSVFMEITPRGRLAEYKIYESYIKSAERMTYNNVTKILDGNKELCKKYANLVPMLSDMQRLARILSRKRHRRGAIEFVTHESKIKLDPSGKPILVERYPITESNGIIEEFMLICNETVAKHLSGKKLPCIYRVHEKPDLLKLERLGEILPLLGVDFEYSADMRPKDFQSVLESIRNSDVFEPVNYLMLRSMAKAKYSEKNLGHFGLAADCYCHFTSPIRRYPDLAVHRILKESLRGGVSGARLAYFKELTVSASVSSSVSEINAADAEITWKSVKKTEYMADKIGEEYDAIVTHITQSGFFAELENTVEGFVAARTLEDGIYFLSDNGLSLEGGENRYTVGDRVRVRVTAADTALNRIDFEVIGTKRKVKGKKALKGGKKKASKADKKRLREVMHENREISAQKRQNRDTADAERGVFESTVCEILTRELERGANLKRDEKRFLKITIGDMASRTAVPVYKEHLYADNRFGMKECLISAARTVRVTVIEAADSFGIENAAEKADFAAEFVCAALRHFDACLKYENFMLGKREREYHSIAKKIKTKKSEK